LGQGGMGEVYEAHDPSLDRNVAVKVLPERLSRDAAMRARFVAEARILAALNHPNVVTIHEVGTTVEEDSGFRPGLPYLVMELVLGRSLADVLKERRLPAPEATSYARQILEGLRAAHQHGLVHRDIKPSNLMLTPDGHVKILDFGLSKLLASAELPA